MVNKMINNEVVQLDEVGCVSGITLYGSGVPAVADEHAAAAQDAEPAGSMPRISRLSAFGGGDE